MAMADMNVKAPNFKVTLGSTTFDNNAEAEKLLEIRVENVADGPDYAEVTLDDKESDWTDSLPFKEDDTLKIELGYHGGTMTKVFDGNITAIEPFRRAPDKSKLVVKGFDPMMKLTRGRKRRSWLNIKDSDIASELAGEAGMGADTDDSGIVHPYVFQNNVTNLDFLYERAKRIGFEVDCHDGKLRFKKPEWGTKVCTLVHGEENISEGSDDRLLKEFKASTSEMGIPSKVTVRHYDPAQKKEIVGSSTDVIGDTGKKKGSDYMQGNTEIQISDQPVRSVEEAEKLAWSILNQRAGAFLTGRGECEGDGRILPGKTVEIKKMGAEIDGEYYVDSAEHRYKLGRGQSGAYVTRFRVRRAGR